MSLIDKIHGNYVFARRVQVLSEIFANLIPQKARVLDVGCGDGSIDSVILSQRPDISIRGVDVLPRSKPRIFVDVFDGKTLPFADDSFDTVMLVDVLHHAQDPFALLREVDRVARETILLKDHLCEGRFDRTILRFMDWIGNARHGVALRGDYWSSRQWKEAFAKLNLVNGEWNANLNLYPWPATWVFDRSLHFVAELKSPADEA